MSSWEQRTWDPRSASGISDYERLCRIAKRRGLGIELRLGPGGLSDIRLSNGMSEGIFDVNDRDRAASVLLRYLGTERYV